MTLKRKNPGHLHLFEDSFLDFESSGMDFEDYYPETASLEKEAKDPYYGRNVIWDAEEGRTVRVTPENATFMSGNIFDNEKLFAVAQGIDNAEERVVFDAPYGNVSVVDLQTIKESLENEDEDGLDRPYTTGDPELDKFLLHPEDFSEEEKIELEKELKEAVEEGSGDLGDFSFNIRDGNHRAFGAFLSGEPYIYMMVGNNQMQDLEYFPDRADGRAIKDILI